MTYLTRPEWRYAWRLQRACKNFILPTNTLRQRQAGGEQETWHEQA
jgi:hypothetical protein